MTNTSSHITQQIILLATGAPGSVKLRNDLLALYETTGNWQQVAAIVDDYMNSQIPLTHNGISGLVQAMASNGLGLKLSDSEAIKLTQDLINSGINTWPQLFELVITELTEELGQVLDHRATGAENFTNLLANLNKNSDYHGSPTLNAAREWVQGIGASETSLLEANKTTTELITTFNDGNVRGTVFDGGYVQDATVFIDENSNGIFDAAERSTLTDETGHFLFYGDIPSSHYIATGGTNLATGKPITGTLSAPTGAVFMTPLTTLVSLMLRNGKAANIDIAEGLLFKTLDIPRVDLSIFDSIASSLNSGTSAQQVAAVKIQAAATQIVNVLNITHALIDSSAPENSDVMQAIRTTLVTQLVSSANTDQSLDLSQPQILAATIKDTATALGIIDDNSSPETVELVDKLVGQTAELLHETNSIVQNAANGFENGQTPDSITALSDMIKLQILTQTDIAPTIAANVTNGDLTTVINQFTGNNLTKSLDEIETGSFDSHTLVNDGSVITNPVTGPVTPQPIVNNKPFAVDIYQLNFDGVDDFVQLGSNPIFEMTTTLTMEAWIKPDSSSNVNQMIINKEGEYEVSLFPDGSIRWAFANTDPGWSWGNTNQVVPVNKWTHIAVSYDNGNINTYINGALAHTFNGLGAIGDAHPILDDLWIGGRSNNPLNKYFDGSIGDVRIWDTARTSTEIADNYNQNLTGSEAGLVGNWRLTEGSGVLASDSSSLNNYGIFGDGVAAQEPGWEGYSTSADGILNESFSGVLSNDFDIDGDSLVVSKVNSSANNLGTPFALASGALLTLNANGSFDYDPNGQFDYLLAGQQASDQFSYTVNDGNGGTDTGTATIVVKANDSPVIISDGGGDTENLNVAENQQAVTTIIAKDATANLTYAITGGTDQQTFAIDATTGVLSFTSARDFENKTDNDNNGIYEVTVQASDSTTTDTQTLNITVTDTFEAPPALNFGVQSGINLDLISPVTAPDGKVYYILDTSGDSLSNAGDKIDHILLDNLLNNSFDTQDGKHLGIEDERSVTLTSHSDGFDYTAVLPTINELQTLYNIPTLPNPPWNNLDSGSYWSSTQTSPDFHQSASLDDPFAIIVASDNIANYTIFQVLPA